MPGLLNGTRITLAVRAINRIGVSPSNTVTPGPTTPGPPAMVRAEPTGAGITVSRTPPADDGGSPLTGYRILASPGASAVTAGPNDTTTTLTRRTAGSATR